MQTQILKQLTQTERQLLIECIDSKLLLLEEENRFEECALLLEVKTNETKSVFDLPTITHDLVMESIHLKIMDTMENHPQTCVTFLELATLITK